MLTDKGERYESLIRQLMDVIGGHGCMVCGGSNYDQKTIDKVMNVLRQYDIDPQVVAAEMRTLNEAFDFVEGWKSQPQHGCYLNTRDFFTVCYKFLK